MASFLTDLAKPYVDKLINGAIAESSYICCFTCIAKDFEEERARLEVERTTVKQRVDVATSRGEDVQANALSWEEEADKLIQEDTRTKQKCFFGFCSHCLWRYRRGKELTNKKEQMKRFIETGKELSIGLPARLPGVERYSSQHYIPFKSRESKYKELLNALKDDNNYVIGLKGMAGTGKTTLAKEIGKELKQFKKFACVIDTTVSLSFDIRKIQDDIAGPLGLKFDDCSESDRPKKLWSRLTNGEKILLILDDVWGDINFVEIGIPQSGNHKGCRILITTRNMLVCNKLECSKTVQLELLSEEDAWTMFKSHACLSEISTKNLLDKGHKIANECKRLPVAIAAIASSLKGIQRPEEWEGALKSLQKHMPMHDVDDDIVKIYECLRFSYDNMKNEKAKRLFLLCSVFREDEEIPIERLIRLGIGAGLFGENYGSYEDARSQVVISKNKLLDSCLLLEAKRSRVKMHDLVRDAAQWIANKEIQTVKLYDKNQKVMVERETNIKYLLCEAKLKDVFSFKLDGSKLEILIVIVHKDEDCHDVKIEDPNSFFENSTSLRVFHLIYDHYYNLSLSLPQSVRSMKNIRSLLFKHVDLGDISILGNLQSLETLDLNHCKIDELPQGITKLEKLKLLNLKDCEIARNNPFEVIEGCSSLEVLYFRGSFNGFCREIVFPKLKRFYINECSSSADDLSMKFVSFEFDDFFLSEATLKYCMQESEGIRLCRIEGGWRNIIPEIVPLDQGMNDLAELHLRCISQLKCLIDTTHTESQVSKVFSKLVVLDLNKLENLEELFNGHLSFDSLNSLEKLSIKDCKHLQSLFKCNLNLLNLKSVSLEGCPMLISLFQLSTAVSLVSLERLEIKECGSLEYIIDEGKGEESRGEIIDDNESTSQGSMFKKLEVISIENITISDCKHLKSLFKCNLNLFNLKSVSLKGCSMLISLFQLSTAVSLVLLERLEIIDCELLENIIIDDNDSTSQAHDLPALKSIIIKSCDKLNYIFGQDVKLGSLESMELDGIPNLIDIFSECNRTMSFSSKEASSISGYASKPQEQSDPIKCNIFSWTDICRCGKKYGHNKLRSTTNTKTSLVSEDQPQDNLMESNSYPLNRWERAQCPLRPSHILCNVKHISLKNVSKMKSLFILSTAPRMLLETLRIWNCDELRHIITIDIGDHHDSTSGNDWGNVFPKLKQLLVDNCMQLEYIVGHYTDDHQNHTEIHLHLPALEDLNLWNLPSLVGMCPKQYHTTFPPLKEFELIECSQFAIKSISNFITHHSVTRSVDGTIIKELSGNVDHIRILERLRVVNNSKVESIFRINEINEQQMNLDLEYIELHVLPTMTCLFVGPTNLISLQNLAKLVINRCEKLKIVFSTSIIRCLPQLLTLRIEECKELMHIIEDDLENKKSSNFMSTTKTCFPKLFTLSVVKCNKLKYVFPITIRKELPELNVLIIKEADELEEIFESECDDQKVVIPDLKFVIFENLPSLSNDQGIQFRAVKHRFIQNCQKLSLASASTADLGNDIDDSDFGYDFEFIRYLSTLFRKLQETKGHDSGKENPSPKTFKDFPAGVEVKTSSEHELTSPKIKMNQTPEKEHELVENVPDLGIPTNPTELMNEQSMGQQRPLGETDTAAKPSRVNHVSEISVEEGTASANTKRITASLQQSCDGQIAIPSPPIAITKRLTTQDVDINTNDDQASLNDDAAVKVTSVVEEPFPKDVEFKVPESKISPIIPPPQDSQTPSRLSKEDPSQNVEDLSSYSFVKRDLEQLVSKKHLGYENLSLLTDFFVKHPSVLVRDTSLSSRYKGYAYNCLAELLNFLQTHSVLDVLGSSHSEFVELLQDARRFPFHKEWLDDIEKRALLPGLEVSQDALQNLLDSKHILTQHVDDLKHQLDSSEAVLQNIAQQVAQILQTRAALSDPIGY